MIMEGRDQVVEGSFMMFNMTYLYCNIINIHENRSQTVTCLSDAGLAVAGCGSPI